jgi:capsular polysaccharide biosynthesis protein
MNDSQEKFKDEIELIDFLRIMWKWKYLIAIGTFLFAVIAAVISLQMTKIYSVNMVLRPGIIMIDEKGRKTYIDSPENIQALIKTGTFDKEILNALKTGKEENLPRTLSFEISAPKASDAVKVYCETPDSDQGIKILRLLSELLIKKYSELVGYYKNGHERAIDIKEIEISSYEAAAQSSKEKIKNIQGRINELKSEVQLINNNTTSLIKERDKLIAERNTNNILSSILYTNTIQQNLTLANTYKNEINTYNIDIQNEKIKIEKHQNSIKARQIDIKNLEFKKDSIQNIQVIQPPTRSPYVIKPKKKLIVLIATFVGLFAMLFFALLIEYVSKHKNKNQQ